MKKQVEDWIKFAEKDIIAAEKIIENSDLANIVVFHCQQAIEKYFKAFIMENEKPLLKIHNLPKLYGTIKEVKDLEIDEDLLALVNKVYLDDRYPGELGLLPDGLPTIEEAREFIDYAKLIESIIKFELK
jgi:HEPN domain-containing protein